jgi:hypothetical protein
MLYLVGDLDVFAGGITLAVRAFRVEGLVVLLD